MVFDSAAVEILFAIGQGHRIIATHSFVSYPPEVESIPRVGDAFNMDLERIVELQPDLVYIFFERFVPDLRRLGLEVLYIQTLDQSFQEVADHVRLWGRITGSTQATEREAKGFEARIAAIEEKLAAVDKGPRIYHHTEGFWTPGSDTLYDKMYTLLKARNIASDIPGWAQISPEKIVEQDPQVVITPPTALDELNSVAAFQGISALQEGNVHTIDPDLLSVAGPRFVDGIEQIARLMYPDIFGNSLFPSQSRELYVLHRQELEAGAVR